MDAARLAKRFQHKLKRIVASQGTEFEFGRKKKTDVGPERDEHGNFVLDNVTKLKGFYHEVGFFFSMNSDASSTKQTEPQPSILTENITKVFDLKRGDLVKFKGKVFDVVATHDIEGWGLFFDISLELIEDGTVRN